MSKRERERERNISTHPTRRHTHKQEADGVRVRKTQDLRAAAVQPASQTETETFIEREDVLLKGRQSHTDILKHSLINTECATQTAGKKLKSKILPLLKRGKVQ